MVSESFTVSGPLFDGKAEAAIGDFLIAVTDEIGKQGVNDVKIMLSTVLQSPTGNYERHIQTERQQNDLAVNDSGIVYGPWLEGIGSRNQTTRFKGYTTFRQVTQRLSPKSGQIAADVIRTFVQRMN